MARSTLLLIILFSCTVGRNSAQTNFWTQKSSYSGAGRTGAIGLSIGSKGYFGLGQGINVQNAQVPFADFWEYDPITNVWTQKASFPDPGGRFYAVGTATSTKGYVGMGYGPSSGPQFPVHNDFWEYDPVLNAWSQKSSCPNGGRASASCFSINGKAYVGLGDSLGTPGNRQPHTDFWEYNPATNLWTNKAPFSGGIRQDAVGFTIGNKGYISCGDSNRSFLGPSYLCNDLWEYDPSVNSWVQKQNFPGTARATAVGFGIGNFGYLGTGQSSGTPIYTSDFWEYSPTTNLWTQRAVFLGGKRVLSAGCSINNKGYIGLGTDSANNLRSDFYEYLPDIQLQTGILNGNSYCAGATLTVPFSATNSLNTGNIFTAQLSNSFGSFLTPVNIGSIIATTSGSITAIIPPGTIPGIGYRVRVVSSSPVLTAPDNGTDLTITAGTNTPTISITASQTIICPNGSITFTANTSFGGTNPQYQWFKNSTVITGATNSIYTSGSINNNDTFSCNLFSNEACITTANAISNKIIIHTGAAVTPTLSITALLNPACAGVADTFFAVPVNGGTAPVYQWKKGGVNVGTNSPIYAAQIANGDVISCVLTSNAQCLSTGTASSNSITMAVSPPNLIITPASGGFCQGDSLLIKADSTTTGLHYQWQVNGNNIQGATNNRYSANYAGVFNVVLNQGSCTVASNNATISVYALPAPFVSIPAPGKLSTFGYVTYQWYLNNVPIPGATNSSYTALQNGNYIVWVTDGNGCKGKSSVTIIGNVGVNSIKQNESIIYPNPVRDLLFISSAGLDHCVITVSDITGKKLIEAPYSSSGLDVRDLSPGMYLLSIKTKDGNSLFFKILKQ